MQSEDIIDRAKKIKLAIFDVDGVLTTGKLIYSAEGHDVKEFHVHDGQGIKFLQRSGVEVAIITVKQSPMVARRMQDLEITRVYQGYADKLPAYEDLKKQLQLTDEEIAYLGDDLPDLPIICRVGLGMTVPKAPKIMQEKACYTTKAKGGKGAVREVCELIMNAQGSYQKIIDAYLSR